MAQKKTINLFIATNLFVIVQIIQPTFSQWLQQIQLCLNNGRQIQGWYPGASIADNYVSNPRWTDSSGNGYIGIINDTTGLVTTELNFQRIITGTTSTQITFPVHLNSNHTVIHLAKYNPTINNNGVKNRILHTNPENGVFGHHSVKAGVAFENGWITDQIDRFGESWLISSQQPGLYRGNKRDFTTGSAGLSQINSLMINQWDKEASDFQFAELIIFNEILTIIEIKCIENYLDNKYNLGITLDPTSNPSISPSNIPTSNPSISPSNIPTQTPTSNTNNPTSNPSKFPSNVPTQTPTSITNDPTVNSSKFPSNVPTNSPNSPPTSEEEYGVIVTVSLGDETDTENIALIITNITSNLVSDIIDSICNKGVTTNQKGDNELEITIRVCDKSSQDTMLIAMDKDNLLTGKINEKGLDVEVIDVLSIGTDKDGEVVEVTDVLFIGDEVSEKKGMSVILIVVIVVISLFIVFIIISCGVAYKINKNKKKKSQPIFSATDIKPTTNEHMHEQNIVSMEMESMMDGDIIITGDTETNGKNGMDDFVVETKGNNDENSQNDDMSDMIIMDDVNETHGNIQQDNNNEQRGKSFVVNDEKETKMADNDSISGSDEFVVNDINEIQTLQ